MKSTPNAAPIANSFMKPARRMIFRLLAVVYLAVLSHCVLAAESASSTISASDLAARLSAWQQDGVSYVRLRMVVSEPAGKNAFQIQIKGRRSKTSTDVIYQILWPKERKGEGVLLQKAGGRSATGAVFVPPNSLRPLDASQMKEAFFGSGLSYEDLVENFFSWEQQAIVGTEEVEGASCYILESKPGKGSRSSYSKVRTWVDTRRLIPLRIEKYSASGELARRIETSNVVTDDIGRQLPANLTVRDPRKNSTTELDGSRIKHDIRFDDAEFTPEALRQTSIPRSSAD
jgi:outer membrane lipoprotein-sorting protein